MLHDKDIREPLFDFLDETYGKIRIIEEKTMGKNATARVSASDVFASDDYKKFLNVMAQMPHYSINNQILIMLQNPEAEGFVSVIEGVNIPEDELPFARV